MRMFAAYFQGEYIGGAAVVLAPTRRTATTTLNRKLKDAGLEARLEPDDLTELDQSKRAVVYFDNGDY